MVVCCSSSSRTCCKNLPLGSMGGLTPRVTVFPRLLQVHHSTWQEYWSWATSAQHGTSLIGRLEGSPSPGSCTQSESHLDSPSFSILLPRVSDIHHSLNSPCLCLFPLSSFLGVSPQKIFHFYVDVCFPEHLTWQKNHHPLFILEMMM